jgi:AcrR family transcriptional regulator
VPDGAEWRAALTRMRGDKKRHRVAVYEALAYREDRRYDSIARLVRDVGISDETFSKHFGERAKVRLMSGSSLAVALAETKDWTWWPYQDGLDDAEAGVRIRPYTSLQATVRCLAQWAQDHPGLARQCDGAPPVSAVDRTHRLLRDCGSACGRGEAAELACAAVLAAAAPVRPTALSVLNTLRPRLERLAAPPTRDPDDAERRADIVAALSDFAANVLASGGGETEGELAQVLDRLRLLLAPAR